MVERRNFHRVPFASSVEINCNGNIFHGELLDISLRGILVSCKGEITVEEGRCCELAIPLLDSEIILRFEADLLHRADSRLGFKFTSEDVETASHLRRLLELNIGSAETIDRELEYWLQEK